MSFETLRFRCKSNPNAPLYTPESEDDARQMRKHPEYEEVTPETGDESIKGSTDEGSKEQTASVKAPRKPGRPPKAQ